MKSREIEKEKEKKNYANASLTLKTIDTHIS